MIIVDNIIGTIGLHTYIFVSFCIFDGDDIWNSNMLAIIKKNDNSNSNVKNVEFG